MSLSLSNEILLALLPKRTLLVLRVYVLSSWHALLLQLLSLSPVIPVLAETSLLRDIFLDIFDRPVFRLPRTCAIFIRVVKHSIVIPSFGMSV